MNSAGGEHRPDRARPSGTGRRPAVLLGPEGPGLSDVERRRADALAELGYVALAFDLLDPAIRREPGLMELYVVRAHAHLAEGSAEPARADLRRAAELDPDAPWLAEIIAAGGAADEIDGRLDAALAAYRRALRIYPANQTARAALRRLAQP